MLESVGLAQRDHDVYRALLLHPGWDVRDIEAHLGLTGEEVCTALDRLSELSLLHAPTDVPGFVPASPEVGLRPLLQRIEAELDERRARLSRDRAVLANLASEYASLRVQAGTEGVERLDSVDSVRSRLQELSQRAAFEVRAFMPGGALSATALEYSRPLDEQSLRRGVRMQTVYLDSVRKDQRTVAYASWFSEHGGQTRTAPSLPMRLIICDRSVAVLPVNEDSSREGALVIHLTSVVSALNDLFCLVWERATPLGESVAPDAGGPSERDLALLKMLEEGLTDECIGRKLGVSIRTVRRLMADLLKRLNSQSRFQAGVEAARLGWI
ncbi:LuxR C-terminal-related transcriptional regulator [Kitasatospora sp. NPDC054939]